MILRAWLLMTSLDMGHRILDLDVEDKTRQ